MKSLTFLLTWLLPLGLFAAGWLAVTCAESVNVFRRKKRMKRLMEVQSALLEPWPIEPRLLKTMDEFIEEACLRLRAIQRDRRAQLLDRKADGDACGS